MADHLDWPARADLAHRSLAELYGAPPPQLLNNTRPVDDNETFNYWWLAHAVDVALDGWERTGDETHLRTAVEIVENLLRSEERRVGEEARRRGARARRTRR